MTKSDNSSTDSQSPNSLFDGGRVMSISGHLAELRSCVVKSMVAVLLVFFAAMAVADRIVQFLKQPLLETLHKYNKSLDTNFLHPLDPFYISVEVSVLTGLVVASPIWVYQIWRFVEPALYPKEKRYVLPLVAACGGMFIFGIVFCYLVVLPLVLEFSVELGLQYGTPMISLVDYFSLLIMFLLGFGLVFQMPIILFILHELDIVSIEALTGNRSVVFVVILIISALFTPPDPFSMLAMAIPVYLMYEIAILAMKSRRRRALSGNNV